MKKIYLLIIISLLILPGVVAQDTGAAIPDEVEAVLLDLSDKLGVSLTDEDVSITWEAQEFPDTSLGCPQPDMMYAQVFTAGYTIIIEYQDVMYDYRVAEGGDSVILCSPPADEIVPIIDVDAQVAPEETPAPDIDDIVMLLTLPLTLSPATGAPGDTLQLTVSGYPSETDISIRGGLLNDAVEMLSGTTDEAGNFEIDITIPEDAPVDVPYSVEIVSGDRSDTVLFIPSGDSDAGSDVVIVYLIAPGSDNPDDVCSDLPVAIASSIDNDEMTVQDAMNELYNLNDRDYETGTVYNALYPSTLNISAEVMDSVAVVNLTGTLFLGDACDGTWIETQIEQTMLQFSDVEHVEIFINEQPLADYLLPENDE
ncbi:MAG: GerMN domain-containing protein [Aggregatilineales bacterium]